MVVEVMGRYAGWIALHAGIAGGADVILIPEIPFDLEKVAAKHPRARSLGRPLQHRRRRRGRQADGRRRDASRHAAQSRATSSASAASAPTWARELERLTGKETRVVVLGHLQRGGAPTPADRVLATRFGAQGRRTGQSTASSA